MTPAFPLKSAAELMDASFDARWLDRARIGPAARATLRAVLDRFVADGGPWALPRSATTPPLPSWTSGI